MKQTSIDETEKFLFQVGWSLFRTVLMKHHYGNCLCIYKLVVCKDVIFVSDDRGLIRNLDAGGIMAQVIEVQNI